ncbi:MAG: hypothetical protein ACLGJB_10915 [Blastocatellia bacterium]
MRIRSTERTHEFTKSLFESLAIFNLGGLTLSDSREFTAGIEAFELDEGEGLDFKKVITLPELEAKFTLSNILRIPLLFLVYESDEITVYQVIENESFRFKRLEKMAREQFPAWWRRIKHTNQQKPIYEATPRIAGSVFDTELAKAGLAWGGNIDGFILKEGRVLAIVENIYTQKNPLGSHRANPATYFRTKGPNYNSWLPSILLAGRLGVPLFLFTFEGNSSAARMGFSVIDHLGRDAIHYRGAPPNENILSGFERIRKTIIENLSEAPPYLA